MHACDFLLLFILIIIMADFIYLSIYCRIMPYLEHRNKKKKEMTNEVETNQGDNHNRIDAKKSESPVKKIIWWFVYNYSYGLMRYTIILVGKFPSFSFRNLLYKYIFNMKISSNTEMRGGCEIRSPWNFMARRCVIGNNCIIDARNGVFISDDVVLGVGVHIWTEEHDVNDKFFAVTEDHKGAVVIKEHAWICSDSTILPGIVIEEGAVLASRGCATRNLDAFGIYGGVPAKKISERNCELEYHLSGKPTYNFY